MDDWRRNFAGADLAPEQELNDGAPLAAALSSLGQRRLADWRRWCFAPRLFGSPIRQEKERLVLGKQESVIAKKNQINKQGNQITKQSIK